METHQIIRTIFDSIHVFSSFVVLVVATVIVFVLWKRKEGGTGGALLLMLARTGVWLSMLGFLVSNILVNQIGFEIVMWVNIALRVVLLVSILMTIGAFLLIKPAKAVGQGGASYG